MIISVDGEKAFDKNSSIYDPYWSVSPVAISIAFLKLCGNINAWSVFAVVLISVWGIRLTINWAYKFNHLKHQDWRYTELNEKHPKTYFLIAAKLSAAVAMPVP